MREPDFDNDGWSLDDAEEANRKAPDTFWIPPLEEREALRPGDLVKLIFRISVDNEKKPVAIERMWVLVRGRVGDQYLGILDNDPYAIDENDELWSGVELPFSARHVIDIDGGDETTLARALALPRRHWPRS
ncbi:hypothetical protein [Chelativorans salis]|uniref:DUF2314 domain-containing protein n=1 Tax=Chelativorans salis TaxID=2978478 RepID=A0ABT2LQS4_9HYPH|nr:hypothetical protein [Chelativorans sp. EGI FJ00035]MCT7376900.1 hypothetical protein [Chelativorans sp. EGI FJ00035]